MAYETTAEQENEFWAWADAELARTAPDLHDMPAARHWVVWLLPPQGNPFPIHLDVEAGYLGQGEAALVEQHCALHYPDHLIGEMWPKN